MNQDPIVKLEQPVDHLSSLEQSVAEGGFRAGINRIVNVGNASSLITLDCRDRGLDTCRANIKDCIDSVSLNGVQVLDGDWLGA